MSAHFDKSIKLIQNITILWSFLFCVYHKAFFFHFKFLLYHYCIIINHSGTNFSYYLCWPVCLYVCLFYSSHTIHHTVLKHWFTVPHSCDYLNIIFYPFLFFPPFGVFTIWNEQFSHIKVYMLHHSLFLCTVIL